MSDEDARLPNTVRITITPSTPSKEDSLEDEEEEVVSQPEILMKKEEEVVVRVADLIKQENGELNEINDSSDVIRQDVEVSDGASKSDDSEQRSQAKIDINGGKNCSSVYPKDYNPFGDEDEEEVVVEVADAAKMKEYPTDLNPFGDESEEEDGRKSVVENKPKVVPVEYNGALNPFGSDDDDDDEKEEASSREQMKPVTPVPAPRRSLQPSKPLRSSVHSHSTSSLERNKSKSSKIPPPRPPPPANKPLKHSDTSTSLDSAKLPSLQSPTSSSINSTPEKGKRLRKKPAPRPPNVADDGSNNDLQSNSDMVSLDSVSVPDTPESSRRSERSSDQGDSLSPAVSIRSASPASELDSYSENKSQPNSETKSENTIAWRKKKRQAPPIPIPMRIIASGTLEEIQQELSEIGDKLVEIEKRTSEVVDIMKREGNSHRHRKLIYEYLTLAQEQCTLARKQEELSYLKREHKLEEDHADTEYKTRIIMAKADSMKTEEDSEKEQELLQRLVEIIEERNEIVENMMKIDKRGDFNALVEKVKQIKGVAHVEPILADFMKHTYNEKNVKSSEIKYKTEKLKVTKAKNKRKGALNTLKRMAKVNS